MHSPRPYGLLVVNGELTDKDSLFIDQQLKKISNEKAISELDSIRRVKDLPDGGYVILQNMGGILKAIAYKELSLEKFEQDGFAKLYVPMLYSGVITKARTRKEDGVSIKLTEQSRRRLINYATDGDLPAKDLRLQRFVIEPNFKIVPEFIPQNSFSDIITTQYVQQRPTWYSGAMAEVVQIAGGYGRQDFNNLPDLAVEKVRIEIPEKYMERISQEINGIRLPAYSGIPPLDGAFQFDYKFNRTHGICFDNNNAPWLIQVSPSGVHAMPLPIIPATATAAFREYMHEVGDDEILAILDRFGAMPSGEGFPTGRDFEAWRRAGVIIKVCDAADFYSHQSYSPACGWSFNLYGTEGFNTCYSYNDEGIAVGKAFKIQLNFSGAINRGWLNAVEIKNEYRTIIHAYLSKLFTLLGKDNKSNAILYKLRRVPQEDIFFQAEISLHNPLGVTSVDIDYWDNLEIEPIATLNGRINQVGEGFLYHPAKPEFQPQIKFPIVEMGGCISFDFGAFSVPQNRPNCDTIMFGYYIENSLKVVKYFVDWRSYTKQIESDFEPVMTVGSWKQVETIGQSSPQGYFYTTDFDFREIFSPVVTTTSIKGEDQGFDSKPFFEFDAFFARPGTLWRHRYYTHLSKTTRTEHESIKLGVCIPYLNRNAILLAKQNTISGGNSGESYKLYAMRDPTTYRYWTYDFVFAWRGGLEKMTGKPSPKDGNPVWVEIENYNPAPYSDFADQGSWLPGLPYDITWLIHPKSNEWNHSGGGGAPKIQEYSHSTQIKSETNGGLYTDLGQVTTQVNYKIPNAWYFTASPDKYGNVFYREACRVVFGDSEYANISETDQYNRRYNWGYTRLVEHKSAYHFIGVINE